MKLEQSQGPRSLSSVVKRKHLRPNSDRLADERECVGPICTLGPTIPDVLGPVVRRGLFLCGPLGTPPGGPATMASTNKCLAGSNKSRTAGKATKRRTHEGVLASPC